MSLRRVAEGLRTAADTDRSDSTAWYPVLERLLKLPLESLDQIPNEGVVSFNPNHPTRAIMEDLERYVGDVKKRHNIAEVRRRHDKLPEYFAVWDAREGWTGAGYDRRRERRLTDIAGDQGKPVKTVSDHYRAAFEAIFGTAYTPDLWLQLLFPIKFLGDDGLPVLPHVGRPLKVRTPRPVPESVLTGPNAHVPLLKAAGAYDSEIAFADLQMDIQSLIATGTSDSEICEILELSEGSIELVAYFRERSAGGL